MQAAASRLLHAILPSRGASEQQGDSSMARQGGGQGDWIDGFSLGSDDSASRSNGGAGGGGGGGEVSSSPLAAPPKQQQQKHRKQQQQQAEGKRANAAGAAKRGGKPATAPTPAAADCLPMTRGACSATASATPTALDPAP